MADLTRLLLALLATPAAASDCLPYASAAEAIKGNGMALTFEGFADGGSLQVFTARDGTWLVIVKTDDDRACPLVMGEAHNVTLGSLL